MTLLTTIPGARTPDGKLVQRIMLGDKEIVRFGSTVQTNLALNPTPASLNGWTSNSGTQWTNTYSGGEVSADRLATAPADWAASLLSHGVHTPANPVLAIGSWWQRSVEIWVDAPGSVKASIATNAWRGGQPLAAGQWTRVVENFQGDGIARYVCAIGVTIPGVGTGVHVKFRRGQLVECPSGVEQPYFDGTTPDTLPFHDYGWTGAANASTSIDTRWMRRIGQQTNLIPNPAPGSVTNWLSNDGNVFKHTYAGGEISVERLAKLGAAPDTLASWYNTGLTVSNPVLPAGTKYQRSIEIWVDLPGATLAQVGGAGAFVGGQALPANQWTRVVEQFTATGAATGWMGAKVSVPNLPAARINQTPDPRGMSLTSKTASATTSPNMTTSLLTGLTGHPAGFTTAFRGTVVAAQPTITAWYIGQTLASGNAPAVGQWTTAGVWFRTNVARQVHIRTVNVNGSASTNGTVTLVQANTWTWLSVVGQYTAGSTSLSVIIGVDDGPPPQAGDTQDFTGLIVEYLDGTKPAVPASGSYFDGDTPDDAANLVDYSWTGTAGASTSQRAVGLG